MKLKYFVAIVFLFLIPDSSIGQSNPDSVKWKQFSVGYNVLRSLIPNGTTTPLPVVFIKYRVNDHAFRLSMNSGYFDIHYRYNYSGLPTAINNTDSSSIYTYKYSFNSGGSVNLSFEKYQRLKVNNNLEFYVGIGFTGGSSLTEEGNNYVTYLKDSIGIFQLNDSISSINFPVGVNNYKSTQFGIVPYRGILFMPDKLFSAEFEVSAPIVYESKIPRTSAYKHSSGIYFNMLFSINIILNFDLNFNDDE
ncbi:MAG: hypothetical protein D4R43_02135 [Sphingobacteriales bacterium]|nr:MAG: hypothetical protein D4R43_02135 [Sphingobacteriales bacterium]